MNTIKVLFFICIAIVAYTYVGYGIILFFLIKIKRIFHNNKKTRTIPSDDALPDITLLICAYNEETVIKQKMTNCYNLKYPKSKLKLIWVTDGSDDSTNDILSQYPDVKIIYSAERRGKTAALNHGMKEVKTPIVAFTDANTMLNENAILNIAARFQDLSVGCVSGEKRVKSKVDNENAAEGEGLYWRYESTLKRWDNELYSTMGAAGELFAIRTNLYCNMPEDTLLDDFITSMKILMQGFKIAYASDSYAVEYSSANMKEEAKRKRRISAGGLQSIWRLRPLLNPFKYPVASFQYISHRVLRWSIAPVALMIMIPLNAILLTCGITYIIIFLLQIIFYAVAYYGYYQDSHNKKTKIAHVIYYFLFMNINIFRGMKYLYLKKDGTWEKAKRS